MSSEPIPTVYFILLFFVLLGIFWLRGFLTSQPATSSEPQRYQPPAPAPLEDAEWYREESKRMEALTEFEMKKAELEDTRQFLADRHHWR